MARSYFDYFKKEDYQFSEKIRKQVTNLSQYTAMFSDLADNASFYNYYNVQPGERLDTISQKFYGTPQFYWTIPLLNEDIVNVWNSTFLETRLFEQYVLKKYPGLALFAHETTPVPNTFRPGEFAAFNIETTCQVIDTFASNNYIHVDPRPLDFNPLDLSQVWVLLTGLWNEQPSNLWDDVARWKDNTFHLIGLQGGAIDIESILPLHLAPSFFEDFEGNVVSFDSPVQKTPVTWSEVELRRVDLNSRIKVLRPEVITQVVRDFEREMRKS